MKKDSHYFDVVDCRFNPTTSFKNTITPFLLENGDETFAYLSSLSYIVEIDYIFNERLYTDYFSYNPLNQFCLHWLDWNGAFSNIRPKHEECAPLTRSQINVLKTIIKKEAWKNGARPYYQDRYEGNFFLIKRASER